MGDIETKSIEGMSDGDKFQQTMQVLDLLGVGPQLQIEIQQILAGVLYLGQIPFLGDTQTSYIDPSTKHQQEFVEFQFVAVDPHLKDLRLA